MLQKIIVAIVLLGLLAIQVALPVVSASEIDGSVRTFGFNNPTAISNVVITDSGGTLIDSGIGNADLTRTSDFIIQFDVFDLDGFDHLDVYVALFNNDLSSKETSSGALATHINSGVKDRGFVVRWIAPERSVYLSGLVASGVTFAFPITSGASNFLVKSGTTAIDPNTFNSGIVDFVTASGFNEYQQVSWEVTSGVTPTAEVTDSGVVSTFDDGAVTSSGVRNIQYTVRIPFKLSKVAPSSGVWNVGVMVHDRLQQEITEAKTDVMEDTYKYAVEYYKNQFYGELEIVGNSVLSFTDVAAGSGFEQADQSGESSGIQVRFTSNGTYNQQVQSDTTWTPQETLSNTPAFAFLAFNSGLSTPSTADSDLLLAEGNRFVLQARRIKLGDSGLESGDFVDINPDDPSKPAYSANFIIPRSTTAVYRQATGQIPDGDSLASRIGPVASADGTTEAGVVSIFEFQLKLSPVFQNTTYNGNITIGISNIDVTDEFFDQD